MVLGEKDKAFEWLEKAVEIRDPKSYHLKTINEYRDLHSDPRWIVLMRKMGFEG